MTNENPNFDDDLEPPSKLFRQEGETTQKASYSFIIHPLLDEQLYIEETPLIDFRILHLADKKMIGKVSKIVPEFPVEFRHLKRVDSTGRIAIQPASEEISEELMITLANLGINSKNLEKPKTRRQAESARKYWPTKFHPHKETEALLNDTYFSAEDKEYVRRFAEKARVIGCIVVQKYELLAQGSSSSKLLGHPTMQMIDNLAKQERKNNEYLATDCDVFLDIEPCAMCAMALVHARSARVFFVSKSTNGVLATGTWQLHLVPSFNHHYKVFHVDFGDTHEMICR